MSTTKVELVRAVLTEPDRGLIEFSADWRRRQPPPLHLEGGPCTLEELQPTDPFDYGAASGYFLQRRGQIAFVLDTGPVPWVAEEGREIYLAGGFNGWQEAVGNRDWKLRRQTIDDRLYFVWRGPAEPFFADGGQRFKFVTDRHEWLPVPEDAPNVVRDAGGHVNRVVVPAKTGRHLFTYHVSEPLDLHLNWLVRFGEGDAAQRVPLLPGRFFRELGTDLPLGALPGEEETIFRLFAPRAQWVRLAVFDPLDDPEALEWGRMEMIGDGVWEARREGNLHGLHYWYRLDGPKGPLGHFDGNFRILDPYALAAVSRDGPGIVIDRGRYSEEGRPGHANPSWEEIVVLEAHVRDLLAHAPLSLKPDARLGFTGLARWVEQEDFYPSVLGINALELQPIQQNDAASHEEYHWGYMTTNYFAPHSGYGLDPAAGSQVQEFRELVDALHRRGFSVILDVVYNHVGEPAHLLMVDKYYYFEVDQDGHLSNWSGCGNDLCTGAKMARRLVIDSLVHLLEFYRVDGFRFDLAELLGKPFLREIEAALKKVRPDVILIAEPWSFRGHIGPELRDTGFASWNDGYRNFLREYVRGHGTHEAIVHYFTGSPGHYASWPSQTVNYAESHDDRAWIDLLTEHSDGIGVRPTWADIRRTHLMAAFLLCSTGMPMLHAGVDLLHSKQGVNNTYQRGDLNALDYRRAVWYPSTHDFFRAWIRFRRSEQGALLRHYRRPEEGFHAFLFANGSAAFAVVFNANGERGQAQLLAAFNPGTDPIEIDLGGWGRHRWVRLADQDRFVGAVPALPDPAFTGGAVYLPPLGLGLWHRTEGD